MWYFLKYFVYYFLVIAWIKFEIVAYLDAHIMEPLKMSFQGQEKGQLSCHVCGRTPNNLWLCLFPQCWMLGCSDDEAGSPDCSTKHHDRNPTHVVQFNVRTKKIWCYACTR